MNPFDWLFDLIDTGVERFFSINNVALWIALSLLFLCAAIIIHNANARYRPLTRQLDIRLANTDILRDAETDAEAQRLFAAHFDQIDGTMMDGPGTALRHAWRQFKETLIVTDIAPIRATTRPEGYFLHLGDGTRVLAWWANIFVAIGLTFTFLGIVAALHKTVAIMSAGADQAGMLAALTGLLKITAAKFWTSIGGVGASILLRIFDRRWHSATLHKLELLCERVEYGTLYVPAQRLAAEQVERLELLPVRIAEALSADLRPAVAGLARLSGALDAIERGGATAGESDRGAGMAMLHLATALADLTRGLEVMNGRLVSAGGQASEEIVATTQALSEARAGILAHTEDVNQVMVQSANAAADRNAELLMRAGKALESATKDAAHGMTYAVDEAVRRSAEESARVLTAAFAVFSERFDVGGNRLSDAMAATGRETQAAAAMLSQAARDAASAAAPIREASKSIAEASLRTHDLLQRTDNRANEHQKIMLGIAASLGETSDAATRAWATYRDRFEALDETLGRALDQVAAASLEHAVRVNEHVGRIDSAFARSVEQLAQTIAPLRKLSNDLEALLQRARKGN